MDNLINETNIRLQAIVDDIKSIKEEYEYKLVTISNQIDEQLELVKQYKKQFFDSKETVEKMNSDIIGFEKDYQNLVDRFKDDELANILIAANKEISIKIDERKRKIMQDRSDMNELVAKARKLKQKLVKLKTEKKTIETYLVKINDAYNFYSEEINRLIEFAKKNKDNLGIIKNSHLRSEISSIINNDNLEDDDDNDNISTDELINIIDNNIDDDESYIEEDYEPNIDDLDEDDIFNTDIFESDYEPIIEDEDDEAIEIDEEPIINDDDLIEFDEEPEDDMDDDSDDDVNDSVLELDEEPDVYIDHNDEIEIDYEPEVDDDDNDDEIIIEPTETYEQSDVYIEDNDDLNDDLLYEDITDDVLTNNGPIELDSLELEEDVDVEDINEDYINDNDDIIDPDITIRDEEVIEGDEHEIVIEDYINNDDLDLD